MDVRSEFPIFSAHPDLIYLDSASTTQKPQAVLSAMDDHYRERNANVHRALYPMGEQATARYEQVRDTVRDFLNADSSQEVVFTRGTTESLNLIAQGWGRDALKPGDEIVLTVLEHHSNLVPWQLIAARTGAVLKWVPLNAEGDLDDTALESLCGPRTRVVCATGLSNTLGVRVKVERFREAARRSGALFGLDMAQYVAHAPLDVSSLGVDFLAFSGHKMYGPTGVGVLYAKRSLLDSMQPWMGGGDMIREVTMSTSTWNDLPWKFEPGTPPIAEVIGLGAALEQFRRWGWEAIAAHEQGLYRSLDSMLAELPFVRGVGPRDLARRTAVRSFVVDGVHPHDVASFLGQRGVCVRAGHHCTMPLMQALGVTATTRVSLGVYNTLADVEALREGLLELARRFKLM